MNARNESRGGRDRTNSLSRTTYSKLRIVLAALAVALVTVAPAVSAPDVPQLVGPNDGDTVAFLPVFSWDPVAGADKYTFVLSADLAFNSPIYQVTGTKNSRATPDKTVPNGTYYWRVQAVDAAGNTSGWSETRQIEKLWADSPVLSQRQSHSRTSRSCSAGRPFPAPRSTTSPSPPTQTSPRS
jgi:hypothetical protein